MVLRVRPGSYGARTAAPPSMLKLVVMLLTYGLHILAATVRGSPVDPGAVVMRSVPEGRGTDHGSVPIEHGDPFKKTFDILSLIHI